MAVTVLTVLGVGLLLGALAVHLRTWTRRAPSTRQGQAPRWPDEPLSP